LKKIERCRIELGKRAMGEMTIEYRSKTLSMKKIAGCRVELREGIRARLVMSIGSRWGTVRMSMTSL
jgi:hypothetical protein